MKRLIISGIAFIALTVIASAAGVDDEARRLYLENRLLDSELKMARGKKVYFLFDLGKKKITLKTSGLSIDEFDIKASDVWGAIPNPKPHKLLKRTALIGPSRHKIDPEKEAEEAENIDPAKFELDVLEIKDMPTDYSLTADDGINITMRSSDGFITGLYERIYYLGWYFSRPPMTVINRVMGRPYTSVYLRVGTQAARHVYWSFPEGTECLVSP